jgi:hypothetical protein
VGEHDATGHEIRQRIHRIDEDEAEKIRVSIVEDVGPGPDDAWSALNSDSFQSGF